MVWESWGFAGVSSESAAAPKAAWSWAREGIRVGVSGVPAGVVDLPVRAENPVKGGCSSAMTSVQESSNILLGPCSDRGSDLSRIGYP